MIKKSSVFIFIEKETEEKIDITENKNRKEFDDFK